jgi:hypothetical protein
VRKTPKSTPAFFAGLSPEQRASVEQARRIEWSRQVLHTSSVELHKVPNWLRYKLMAANKRRGWQPAGGRGGVFQLQTFLSRSGLNSTGWCDHWGTAYEATGHGFDFVAEPYLSPSHLSESFRFSIAIGVRAYVSANSWWYPGRTIRLGFYPYAKGAAPTPGDRYDPNSFRTGAQPFLNAIYAKAQSGDGLSDAAVLLDAFAFLLDELASGQLDHSRLGTIASLVLPLTSKA